MALTKERFDKHALRAADCPPGSWVVLQSAVHRLIDIEAAATAPQAVKVPGMAVQALAGEIIAALLADEKDGGFDLTAGLFGKNFSDLVRRWAAAEFAQPVQVPDVIHLESGKTLNRRAHFEGSDHLVWVLCSGGDEIRVLNKFEAQFVDAALYACQRGAT